MQTATKPSRTAPAVKPPAPAAGASTQEQDAKALPPGSLSEDALHQAITRALLDGKLRPGTPLRERYLAESFGVTRGLVRKVLLRLGQEGKLEMHANRGAFVPEPTQAQIQAVYQARKAVEAGLVSMLAQTITAEQLKRLGHHLDDERQASRLARRDESVVLAGDFHLILAEMLGNPELTDIVKRLVNRTQMFVALFEPAQASDCAPDEHEPVIQALASGQAAAAASAMVAHLSMVECRVLQKSGLKAAVPLADILRSALRPQP